MAEIANITIDQGALYQTPLIIADDNGNPLDLTGWTANSHIRKHYSSTNFVPFNIVFNPDRTTGTITLELAGNTSANMAMGRYVYDIKMWDANTDPYRIIQGTVEIDPAVTR